MTGRHFPLSAVLGPLALAFLSAPFVTLAFVTNWRALRFASGDWGAVQVSLGYGLLALPFIVCLGTPLAWWLARRDFRGKWVADVLLLLPLLSPPLAMGILLTSLYGPYSAAGSSLERLGLVLTNSAAAFMLAQVRSEERRVGKEC